MGIQLASKLAALPHCKGLAYSVENLGKSFVFIGWPTEEDQCTAAAAISSSGSGSLQRQQI